MTPPSTAAVIDWGIGGLDTLVRFARSNPSNHYIYFSDSGFTPYGLVPAPALARRLEAVAHDLVRRHAIDQLIVACNAASAALPLAHLPVPTRDVIAPGVALIRAAHAAGHRRIGLIGGAGTIASQAHATQLTDLSDLTLIPVVAQPLSAHVEAGRLDTPDLHADLAAIVATLTRDGPLDALLLACTHYPALAPAFAAHLPGVLLLDPVDHLLHIGSPVTSNLNSHNIEFPINIKQIETTGVSQLMRIAALRAFGITLPSLSERPLPTRSSGGGQSRRGG